MNLLRESEPIDAARTNNWPLIVPPACIALWWPILAVVFNAHVATMFAIAASCLLAIVLALAALADALGIEDGLLHVDAQDLPPLDESEHSPGPSS